MSVRISRKSWSPRRDRLGSATPFRGIGLIARARRRVTGAAAARPDGEGGFILLETIVALTLVSVIMAALTTLFVGVMGSTNHERNIQTAAQIADSAVDTARAAGAAGAVQGRSAAAVNTQFTGATPATVTMPATATTVAPWLTTTSMTPASSSTGSVILPTTATPRTVGSTTYDLSYYVGTCVTTAANTTCTATQTGTPTLSFVRVVVVVTWNGENCGSFCTLVSSVLLSSAADPIFDINQAPPPLPTAATIPNPQTWALNEPVNVPLTALTGVQPYSWTATNLNNAGVVAGSPAPGTPVLGITASGPTGAAITGTPNKTSGSFTVTVTLTDGFLHTATQSFTASVGPTLALATIANQGTVVNTSATVTPSASGGTGSNAWTATGLPAGMAINASSGQITGKPTATGVYTPSITVTDAAGYSVNQSFSWDVVTTPTIGTPVSQQDTIGAVAPYTQYAPTYSCGDTAGCTYTLTGTSVPSWLTINSSTGLMTVNPTVAGTATGLVVTETDSIGKTVSSTPAFTWTVNAAPTITGPGNQYSPAGAAVNVALTTTCSTTPCTYTLNGWPSGWTISSTGVISGTASSLVASASNLTITVKDADNISYTTPAFTWYFGNYGWKALPTPSTAHSTGSGSGTHSGTVNLSSSSYLMTAGATGTITYSIVSAPSWVTLSGSTLTGVAPGAAGSYSVTVQASDSSSPAKVSTMTFTWTIT